MKSAAFAAALALILPTFAAHAHGPERAQHGGVVATASDLSFELVPQGERTTVYVVDHGKPLDTKGASGKLTILNGSSKSEAELTPVGGNRLSATATVGKGAKVVAAITLPDARTVTARFTVR